MCPGKSWRILSNRLEFTGGIDGDQIWTMFGFAGLLASACLSAYPQVTTLTGAMQFSTNSSGAYFGGQAWNTLGGDQSWDLWLAQNPDGSSPINGPTDELSGINLPLLVGHKYQFYVFGAPAASISLNGLNLFFGGNDSTPGISVFGATNSSVFVPNISSSTRTLAGALVTGSGRSFYASNGVVVVLTGYTWNSPATPPGDVCQAFAFTPGGGASFSGSFSLQVWPAATLSLSAAGGAPYTQLTASGSGFVPNETIEVFGEQIGTAPLASTTADGTGSFSAAIREPQHAFGPMDVYAVGVSSHKLGATSLSVTPALAVTPGTAAPGSSVTAKVLGFGAAESVSVYWNAPRQLLGTVTANSLGSASVAITIPSNASPGTNGVIGVGAITKAIGIGAVRVQ